MTAATDTRTAGIAAIASAILTADPGVSLQALVAQTAAAGGVTATEARSLVAPLWQAAQPTGPLVAPPPVQASPRVPAPPAGTSGGYDLLSVLLDRWQLAQDKVRHYEQQHLMGHELFWRTLSVHSAQLLGMLCSPYWTRVAESEREDLARLTRVLDNRPLEPDA